MPPERLAWETFRLPEIPPPLEAPIFSKEELVHLGRIPVTYAAWGQRVSLEDWERYWERYYQNAPFWTDNTKKMIRKVGFDGGFYYPWDFDPFSEDFQTRQALYAAELAERVIKARKWEAVDALVVASASSRGDVAQHAAKILEKKGISVEKALFYGQACNGAMAGVVDLSKRDDFQGGRAVVVGLESLSGKLIDPAKIEIVATFGNGGGALAWVVGQEIEHITGRTVVEHDTKGVISLPTLYDLPQPEKRWKKLYPWYEFAKPEGVEISDDELAGYMAQYFAISDEGVFLIMPESDTGHGEMKGMATAKYFVQRVSPLIAEVQKTYEENFREKYGPLNKWAVFHPASAPVIELIVKSYQRYRKSLEERLGVNLSEIDLPWLMRETGINNISAGASLVQWVEMIKKKLLKLNRSTMFVSMGIGSVIQVHALKIKA